MKSIFFSIFILSLIISCNGQGERLPAPSGKYLTGITYMSLTDSSRKELFDDNHKNFRELTIKIWYPADKKSTPELFLEDPDRIITEFGFTEIYRTLKTNSSKDVKVSSGQNSYPVLIYSHGWGEHYSQNTILMEELASHGYIVFSVAHHYECKFSFYPDGRYIAIDSRSSRFQQIMNEQMNPAAMDIFRKMFTVSDDNERANIFIESCNVMPTALKESPIYWAEDIKFLINELMNINKSDKLFGGKLDIERTGVFGMSMGGLATNEVCISDRRVKAGVNIDGGLYGSALTQDIITPFLFLNSQRYYGYGNLFNSRVANRSYSVTLRNSDHYNFSDYALYPLKNQSQIGTVNPEKPILLMNKVILAFFDKYLLNKKEPDIRNTCSEFDVEYISNEP